jgi:hypothetical protein
LSLKIVQLDIFTRGLIFLSQLQNQDSHKSLRLILLKFTRPNKLECNITVGLNGLPGENTLSYWGHS